MNKKWMAGLWGGLFIVCAGLGFMQPVQGAFRFFLTALSVCFFLPPVILIMQAKKDGDLQTVRLVRNLSGLSLLLTLLAIVCNILAAPGSEVLGGILNSVLIILSSPMVAMGSWFVSLFLWACLLIGSMEILKDAK